MIKVYCINREYSFEFQDLLQNNGYSWHGMGDLDILQRWGGDFSESTIRINEDEKSISANFRKDMNYDYTYPTDKIKILIHLGIQRKPDYSPKKIIKEFNDYKLLESTDRYLYNTVTFKANDEEEFDIIIKNLLNNGFDWSRGSKFNNYPIYLFTNKNYLDEADYVSFYNPQTALVDLNEILEGKPNRKVHPNIFNHKDSEYVMNIFRTGSPKPIYKPKKIDKYK